MGMNDVEAASSCRFRTCCKNKMNFSSALKSTGSDMSRMINSYLAGNLHSLVKIPCSASVHVLPAPIGTWIDDLGNAPGPGIAIRLANRFDRPPSCWAVAESENDSSIGSRDGASAGSIEGLFFSGKEAFKDANTEVADAALDGAVKVGELLSEDAAKLPNENIGCCWCCGCSVAATGAPVVAIAVGVRHGQKEIAIFGRKHERMLPLVIFLLSLTRYVRGTSLSVPLTGCSSAGYFVPIMLADGQVFNVILDTGSNVTSVAGCSQAGCSARCTGCPTTLSPVWVPQTSAGEVSQNSMSQLMYGDGTSWRAFLYTSTIRLRSGDAPISTLVGSIYSASTSPAFFTTTQCQVGAVIDNAYQGIFGLSAHGNPAATNFLGQSGASQFGYFLQNSGGQFWLNSPNTATYANNPTATRYRTQLYIYDVPNTPSNPRFTGTPGFYTANMTFLFQNQPILNAMYLIDSGSTLVSLPDPQFTQVTTALAIQLNFPFPSNFFTAGLCYPNNWAHTGNIPNPITNQQLNLQLSPFQIQFMPLPGQSMQTMSLKPTESYLLTWPSATTPGRVYYCPGITRADFGIQSTINSDPGNPLLRVMGSTFMQNHVVTYDLNNRQFEMFQGATCSDGILNGDEVIIDSGGSCGGSPPAPPPVLTPTPTRTPTQTPTRTPTAAPIGTPTARPPTPAPTRTPTAAPIVTPTHTPTATPTRTPTAAPIVTPTVRPATNAPTRTPTNSPTPRPTTHVPTNAPTRTPTHTPTMIATVSPTLHAINSACSQFACRVNCRRQLCLTRDCFDACFDACDSCLLP